MYEDDEPVYPTHTGNELALDRTYPADPTVSFPSVVEPVAYNISPVV